MTERDDGGAPEATRGPRLGAPRTRVDPRLPAYVVGGFAPLILALAVGEPMLAAVGAPFLALLTLGVAAPAPSGLRGALTLAADRAVEGDLVRGEVRVEWDGEAEVDVVLSGGRGVTSVDPEGVVGWSLPAGPGPVTLPFTVRARSWGVHDVGALWVRARTPRSFVVREAKLAEAPTLRVLPTALRLSRLLRPLEPRAVAGMHVARLRGHGTDFAELRPYQPGDRLRDLSWGTSARLGVPWVRVNHPERTATVVLLLDATFGDEPGTTEALARAARAAWSVASIHLRAQDRVGLLTRGRTAAWLPPRDGRRARWMLLDELLAVGRVAEDPTSRRYHRRRVVVPADALVVGITSLRSDVFIPELLHYRRAGHAAVALLIDTTDRLATPHDDLDRAARRIRLAQRAASRQLLERGGVATAVVTAENGVAPAIVALRRRMSDVRPPTTGAALVRARAATA